MLDYRIDTFLTLYEQMSYRRTAEIRNMTQPGVTQHIHFLEGYYGTKLFYYDGRQLQRTRSAELLKRHVDMVRAAEGDLQEQLRQPEGIHLKIGATKTIGEFVILPQVKQFLGDVSHSMELIVDNTEHLLTMLERGELDFAVIEGVFDKEKYPHQLYKKENFVGICGKNHPFAGKTVSMEALLQQQLVVREKGSGTRMLLQQAVNDRGYSLESFRRCVAVSNFSVICELVAKEGAITFAYEPIVYCREDLATFAVEDMRICGEFNFVYCNERVASQKIRQFFG